MKTKIKRHIAIGDLHGCFDEYLELLKTLQYNSEEDEIILVGDLVDRRSRFNWCNTQNQRIKDQICNAAIMKRNY